MIKRILDRVLSGPATLAALPATSLQDLDFNSISLDGMPTFGAEFENWLENMDWNGELA